MDPRLGALFGLIVRPDAQSFRGFVHNCRPFGSLALPDWTTQMPVITFAICYLLFVIAAKRPVPDRSPRTCPPKL
jgi:hypothetical protein